MKAKEYLEKYYSDIISNDEQTAKNAAVGLATEFFLGEPEKIRKARNIRTDDSFMAAMRELNKKWITLCRLFEQKYGGPVLARTAFVDFWVEKIPEMRDKF